MFRIEERTAILLSWIHGMLLCSAVYLLAACLPLFDDTEAGQFALRCLWMCLPVITGWFAVRRIKGLPFYLLVCVIVTAAVYIMSQCILSTILSAFLFLVRMYPRVIRGRLMEDMPIGAKQIEIWEIPTFLDEPKISHCSLFLIVYLVAVVTKKHVLLPVLFYELVAEIFVIYIYASVSRVKAFIMINRRIANLPVKTMQLMQRAVLGVTLVVLFLFVLPAILYGEEPLTKLPERVITQEIVLEQETEPILGEAAGMEEMLNMLGDQEPYEWPQWVQQLMQVMLYLLCTVGVVLILVLLYQALRRMMQNFAAGQSEDEIILLEEDASELLIGNRKKKKRVWDRTPDRKIRKAYKKMIRKNLKEQPAGSETPSDLEAYAGLENRALRHRLYEKARYSKEACTREEAEAFLREDTESSAYM